MKTPILEDAGPSSLPLDRTKDWCSRPLPFLVLSAWCGLSSGLVEVVALIVRKHFVDMNHFYWMSRHFVWLVPATNFLVFVIVGAILSLLVPTGRGWGRRVATRALGTLTLLPLFWGAFPRIHPVASFVAALGVAMRLVPVLERRATGVRRLVRGSFPLVAVAVPIMAASLWGTDRLREWREAARPLPPAGSPNVLLIVLDTVAADHLGLYGYTRPTSPTIDELAAHGDPLRSGTRDLVLDACHRMRACLRDDGLTSSPPAGSRPLTGRTRPWPSFWGRAGTPRPASRPITRIARPTRGWIAVSPSIAITSFRGSPRSGWPS